MSRPKMRKSKWLILLSGLIFFVAALVLGSIITIGDKLAQIHPYLELGFYLLCGVFTYILFVHPLLSVLFAPAIGLDHLAGKETDIDRKTCRKVAKQLLKKGKLTIDEQARIKLAIKVGGDLQSPLQEIFKQRLQHNKQIVRDYAQLVFISTAISQNGRLDAIMVLTTNFRMVRDLVANSGFRPPLPQLVIMYTKIFMAALLARGAEDIELEEVFPQITAGILGFIPGGTIILSSIMQGVGSSFFTLRIGLMARKYIQTAGDNFSPANARQTANKEALKMLGPVVKEGLGALPKSVKERFSRI